MKYTVLTSPPTPLLRGEGSKITPPSLTGKGAGGLGSSQVKMEAE